MSFFRNGKEIAYKKVVYANSGLPGVEYSGDWKV
jgi:hypothetical protein